MYASLQVSTIDGIKSPHWDRRETSAVRDVSDPYPSPPPLPTVSSKAYDTFVQSSNPAAELPHAFSWQVTLPAPSSRKIIAFSSAPVHESNAVKKRKRTRVSVKCCRSLSLPLRIPPSLLLSPSFPPPAAFFCQTLYQRPNSLSLLSSGSRICAPLCPTRSTRGRTAPSSPRQPSAPHRPSPFLSSFCPPPL